MIFFISLFTFLIQANLNKPRVLVLHSYDQDFSWVNDIDTSMKKVFEKKPYSIRWHYMDTKRNPYQEFKEKAGYNARNVIDSWKPNVIIAVDDNAQEFVTKYYVNNPSIKVVFTGVNAEPQKYKFNQANNVTGVLERIPYNAVKEVFEQVMTSDKKRILHISDSSETSLYIHDELTSFNWAPLQLVESTQINTFDEWKQAVIQKEKNADFLLITHYHTIKRSSTDSTIVPPKEVIDWTEEHTTLPRIGCWGFYVEDGGMMAIAVSPFEQGELAAKMAVDIVDNGTSTTQIPIEKSKMFVMYMREDKIKQYNVHLPIMYEAFARATNNFYDGQQQKDNHEQEGSQH